MDGGCMELIGDLIPEGFDILSLPEVDESLFDLVPLDEKPQGKVPIPPRNRSNKILVDLALLHNEAYDLQTKLDELKRNRKSRMAGIERNRWAQVSRSQLTSKLRALRENEELKSTLKEQTAWRQHLEHLLVKKPRILMNRLDENAWKLLRLCSDEDARKKAIHAIAERERDQIESIMVTKNLLEVSDEINSFHSNVTTSSILEGEAIRHVHLDRSPMVVAESMWNTMQTISRRVQTNHLAYTSQIEQVDFSTLYLRQWVATLNGDFTLECGVVMKKFVMGQTTSIVWRTIRTDDQLPFSPHSFLCDLHGWIEISPHGATSTMKLYSEAKVLDLLQIDQLNAVLQSMNGSSHIKSKDSLSQLKQVFLRGLRVFEVDAIAHVQRVKSQTSRGDLILDPFSNSIVCQA